MISISGSPLAREIASVSVVIPCFRCEQTIRRAVESVLAQTLRPAELILVDDASGDHTLRTLQMLRQEFGEDWIKVISLPVNEGPGTARNAGWDSAHGDYIAFLDADDAWHPRKIEIQHKFMCDYPHVVLSGHGYEILDTPAIPDTGIIGTSHTILSKWALLMSNRLVTPSVMLHRHLRHRFEPGRRHVDDHLLWLQLVCAGLPVVLLSAKLVYIYKGLFGEGGLSANLWTMEKAELKNYWILRTSGCIGFCTTLILNAYSLAKFLRRVLLVCIWRLGRAVRPRSD